jgi:hypothetical protein
LRRTTASPADLVITPDGKLLAVASAMNEIGLRHPETLEEIATLTPPKSGIILGVKLSRDARYLAAQVTNARHDWDLHRLRQSLREIDLDGDSPELAKP